MQALTREKLIDQATHETLYGTCKGEYHVVADYPELDLSDDDVLESMSRLEIEYCDVCGWVTDSHDMDEDERGNIVCPDCIEDAG